MSQLEALLTSGDLRPGDQLPSERDLSAQMGISRASLRESLRVLEALGIIEIRVGGGPEGGAVIRSEPGSGFVKVLELELALGHFSHEDVLGTRIALEEWSCAYAAEHATEEDLDSLEEILNDMDDPEITTQRFNALDTAFHLRISEAGGNHLTSHLMSSLRLAIHKQMVQAYAQLEDWRTTAITVRNEHRHLLSAIRDRNSDAARNIVREHVRSFYDKNIGGPRTT